MLIAIGGTKGGTGKTTLSSNLVVLRSLYKKDVLFVDLGLNGSASHWIKRRQILGLSCNWDFINFSEEELIKNLSLIEPMYDDIIIDIRLDIGKFNLILRDIDFLIMPIGPSYFDLQSLENLQNTILAAQRFNKNLKIIGLLNLAHPRGKENKKYLSQIKKISTCLPIQICKRTIYAKSMYNGLGIFEEGRTNLKACQEFIKLYECIWKEKGLWSKIKGQTSIFLQFFDFKILNFNWIHVNIPMLCFLVFFLLFIFQVQMNFSVSVISIETVISFTYLNRLQKKHSEMLNEKYSSVNR